MPKVKNTIVVRNDNYQKERDKVIKALSQGLCFSCPAHSDCDMYSQPNSKDCLTIIKKWSEKED